MSTQATVHPTVLITGAAKRLGRQIALKLAEAGWNVAVHYRNSKQDAINTINDCNRISGRPESAHNFYADLTNETETHALFESVISHFGRLDAIINNASKFEYDSVSTFCYSNLETHIKSNTAPAITLSIALYSHLKTTKQERKGVVINLLDQKLWNLNPDFLSYTISKAALHSATNMLALALAPLVRVVGIAPGLTLTSPTLSDERFQQLHQLSPLGRSSTPYDIASAVHFAIENQSITGTTLIIDGGQHLIPFERDFSFM